MFVWLTKIIRKNFSFFKNNEYIENSCKIMNIFLFTFKDDEIANNNNFHIRVGSLLAL